MMPSHRLLCALAVLLLLCTGGAALSAQDPPCRVQCGTREVTCAEGQNFLCGKFTGSVDITTRNPDDPPRPILIGGIDLALVLDDFGTGSNDWRGYVYAPQSLVYPIITTDRGPAVSGAHRNRTCTEQAPCELTSAAFETVVSGVRVQRQFVLTVTTIEYEDDQARPWPRTLVGQYRERIINYVPGRTVEVNGSFRLDRPLPVAERTP